MKKTIVFIGILVVLIASMAVAGIAFAQTQTPPNPNCPAGCPAAGGANNGAQGWGPGRGMMGGRWNQGNPGTGRDGNYGPVHEYMLPAMAEAFGLSPEDLQARLDAGDTMWDIAEEQGLTSEQFGEIMLQARTEAMNEAVAAGVITQEQADWMNSRMAQMTANGYGPGSGHCSGMGAGGTGRMGGWRWNR